MTSQIFCGLDYDGDYDRFENMSLSNRVAFANDMPTKGQWDCMMEMDDEELRVCIGESLMNTNMTLLLIGEGSVGNRYISMLIEESIKRDNALLAIRLHNVPDGSGRKGKRGENPLEHHYVMVQGRHRQAKNYYKTYTWSENKASMHLKKWISQAEFLNSKRD